LLGADLFTSNPIQGILQRNPFIVQSVLPTNTAYSLGDEISATFSAEVDCSTVNASIYAGMPLFLTMKQPSLIVNCVGNKVSLGAPPALLAKVDYEFRHLIKCASSKNEEIRSLKHETLKHMIQMNFFDWKYGIILN
jgi:hypothetical protein